MNSIQYNFKSIPIIPKVSDLIDSILSKTQSKTPTVTHPGYKITRIRKFYMRKVRFTEDSITEKLESITKNFPKLDDIHPFYADMINILYDKDHYKLALGTVNTAKNICQKIASDYVKLLKYGDSLYRCKQLKVAALGRMMTTLKKLGASFNYLEEVRKHLSRFPSIDPTERTLILAGFPNVGKSSFMNKITYADSEVQAYHFTTQSLFVGHTYYKNIRWQVIDTPGILDRALEQRNIIEMQTITALAHLDACILYFVDVSENCGYSIAQQVSLFDSIRPLFKNKPLVIIANKTDLRKYTDLPEKDRKLIEEVAKEHQTYLIQMSNTTGNGVFDVKSKACDILLKYREVKNSGAKTKDITGLDKIYIAKPTQIRDNRKRTPNIPQSFLEEKKIKLNEEKNEKFDEEKFLREDNINNLEKKIKNNKFKEVIEANGGTGIYYFPLREEFKLENPDWKYDIWPEFMDGKNVFDFVDKDILKKVEALEKEEEEIAQRGDLGLDEDEDNNNMDDGEESSELSEDLIEAHEKLMKNVKTIKERHKLVKRSKLPSRLVGDSATDKFMSEVRPDLKEKAEKIKLISHKLRRDQKEKMRSNLKKDAGIDEEDDKISDSDEMDIEEENQKTVKKKKISDKKSEKVIHEKNKIVQRLQKKIQKKFDKNLQINETDRRIDSKKQKFFNTGKRGLGKTDWR
jgi:nucleolar GTP-binding protein